jgi:hypothetical protein
MRLFQYIEIIYLGVIIKSSKVLSYKNIKLSNLRVKYKFIRMFTDYYHLIL